MPLDKIKYIKRDGAVSPVIAVMLMVMLTIVVAGIFAVGIISMGSSQIDSKNVAVTADTYSTDSDRGITVTVWGGTDVKELTGLRAYVGNLELFYNNGESTIAYNPIVGGIYPFSTATGKLIISEGGVNSVTTSNPDMNTLINDQVNIIGIFSDGTEQILYTTHMVIPPVTSTEGIYLENEYIKVYGYSNSEGWLGHGLLFEVLQPENVSFYENGKLVSSMGTENMGSVNSLINSYTVISDLTNPEITVTKTLFGNTYEYFKTDEAGHKYYFLHVNPGVILPYNKFVNKMSNTIIDGTADSLKINIDITITVFINGEKNRLSYSLNDVIIPERVNIFETPYTDGNVFDYIKNGYSKTEDTIQIELDKHFMPSEGNVTKELAFYITKSDTGEHILVNYYVPTLNKNSDYFTTTGHLVHANFSLEDYSDSDIFEVYINEQYTYKPGTSFEVWYLVDSKTIGELIH